MPSPLERLRTAITQRLQDHPVVVNAPEWALSGIRATGDLRNQFETGTSGGLYDPRLREIMEKDVLGLDYNTRPANRPVYGYVGDAPSVLGDHAIARDYGNYSLVMHPQVKDRSTFSVGDSLGFLRPYPERGAPRAFSLGVSDDELMEMLEYGERVIPDSNYSEWSDRRWSRANEQGFKPWVYDYMESQVDRRQQPLTLNDVAVTVGPGDRRIFDDIPHLERGEDRTVRALRRLGVYAEGGRVDGR